MRRLFVSVIAVTLSMLSLASGIPSANAAVNAPALISVDKQSAAVAKVYWRYGYRHRPYWRHRYYGYRPYRHYGFYRPHRYVYRPYWRRANVYRPYRHYGYSHRPYWRGYGYRRRW